MADPPVAAITYLLYSRNATHHTFTTSGLPDGLTSAKTVYQEMAADSPSPERYPIYCYKIKYRTITPAQHLRVIEALSKQTTFRGYEFGTTSRGSVDEFRLDLNDE